LTGHFVVDRHSPLLFSFSFSSDRREFLMILY